MLNLPRNINKLITVNFEILTAQRYTSIVSNVNEHRDEFKPLNLKYVKGQAAPRKHPKQQEVLEPRSKQMPVDQDWGNVWPGPKSFHPATVPLPIRQGYAEKGAPPDKYANAEIMKIPNFLHLTPPVIKRQCEALKKFCTPWPKALDSDENCQRLFPLEVASSDYCFSSPSIRNPLARIVTVKLKLSSLKLNEHAKDKMLRLVGDRYDKKTDILTIVTDRCPTKKQNYDYAMYLITALYHESWNVEPWENKKSDADMEYYDWNNAPSKKSFELLMSRPASEVKESKVYIDAVNKLMNEGESEYSINNYSEAVRKVLQLPSKLSS